jgi:hypothetical protein
LSCQESCESSQESCIRVVRTHPLFVLFYISQAAPEEAKEQVVESKEEVVAAAEVVPQVELHENQEVTADSETLCFVRVKSRNSPNKGKVGLVKQFTPSKRQIYVQVVGEGEESIIVPHVTAVEVVRVLNLEDFEEQQEEQARVCGKLSGKLFELSGKL